MTSIKPIRGKATITIELSFYGDSINTHRITRASAWVIQAVRKAIDSIPHDVSWVARADTEIVIEAGYTDTMKLPEEYPTHEADTL